MQQILDLVKFVQVNWGQIALAISSIIGAASIIIKLTPTLKDDDFFLPIVKFIGKYIALNVNVEDLKRPE